MQDISNDIVIGAIDVGAPRNIGWAILDGTHETHGNDLNAFIDAFAERAKGRPSALGFECPLFIPLRTELSKLTSQRVGENGRPWSAGAGATVTTIGLAIVTYTLVQLRKRMDGTATLDWKAWPAENSMLLWEAFVSGANHAAPGEHWRDALNAARGFQKALPDLDGCNAVTGTEVLSLVGACALRAGWSNDASILHDCCLVIRPDPEL